MEFDTTNKIKKYDRLTNKNGIYALNRSTSVSYNSNFHSCSLMFLVKRHQSTSFCPTSKVGDTVDFFLYKLFTIDSLFEMKKVFMQFGPGWLGVNLQQQDILNFSF